MIWQFLVLTRTIGFDQFSWTYWVGFRPKITNMAFTRHYGRVFRGFVMYHIYELIESTSDCIAAYILNFMHVIHVRTVYIHIAS